MQNWFSPSKMLVERCYQKPESEGDTVWDDVGSHLVTPDSTRGNRVGDKEVLLLFAFRKRVRRRMVTRPLRLSLE